MILSHLMLTGSKGRGALIVFEGRDGCGKKTQSERLHQKLARHGVDSIVYSFPRDDRPLGRLIYRELKNDTILCDRHPAYYLSNGESFEERFIPSPDRHLGFQCLMLADKLDALPEMKDKIASGHVVIADRWRPSGECYAPLDGLDVAWVTRIQIPLEHGDVNFLLDTSREEIMRRRPEARDRYERDIAKQDLLRQVYLDYFGERARQKGAEDYILNGDRSEQEIEENVWQAILGALYRRASGSVISMPADALGISIQIARNENVLQFAWRGLLTSVPIEITSLWCDTVFAIFAGKEGFARRPGLGIKNVWHIADSSNLALHAGTPTMLEFCRILKLMSLPMPSKDAAGNSLPSTRQLESAQARLGPDTRSNAPGT